MVQIRAGTGTFGLLRYQPFGLWGTAQYWCTVRTEVPRVAVALPAPPGVIIRLTTESAEQAMSLAERRVEYPRDLVAASAPSRSIATRHTASPSAMPGQPGRATALSAGARGAYRRLDDALLFAGVVSLLFVMAFFLYIADPLVHHDVNTVWHVVEIGWASQE